MNPNPEKPPQPASTAESSVASTRPPADVILIPAPEESFLGPVASEKWDMSTKRTILVILFIIILGAVWISSAVIPLLIASSIIAYVLKPIVDLGERIRIPRSVTTLALFTLVAIIMILTPVLIGPLLVNQLVNLFDYNVNEIITNLILWTQELFNRPYENIQIAGNIVIPLADWAQQIEQSVNEFQFTFFPTLAEILTYVQQLLGTATNVVGSTATLGFSVVGTIVQAIFTTVIVFVMSLYLTKDAPRIRRYLQELVPQSYQPELTEVLRRISYVWRSFFRGQVALSLVIGATTTLSLQLVGMPGALILGIVAGVMEIIPNLGPVLAMVPAVIVALIQGSSNPTLAEFGNLGFAAIIVGIYFIIQQVENSVIVPRIIGDSVNLHPVVIICGVIVGFSIGGILGAFLAAPIIASMRVVGGYIHAKLLDYPPFTKPFYGTWRGRTYRRVVTGEDLRTENAPDEASTERALVDENPTNSKDIEQTTQPSTQSAANA